MYQDKTFFGEACGTKLYEEKLNLFHILKQLDCNDAREIMAVNVQEVLPKYIIPYMERP